MNGAGQQFGRASEAYRAFRPAYPPELFEQILARVPASRRERAVDLGAGTGLSTSPLCSWFREVIAVEPDAAMAASLPALSSNLVVQQCTAEECDLAAASVDLVTCGTGFYWMDGLRVLQRVAEWLRPGGVLAVFRGSFPGLPENVRGILARELAQHWDAYRHDRLRDEGYSERTVRAASGFDKIEVVRVPNTIELTAAQLAGFMRSTSFASAYARALADPSTYWVSLEAEVQSAAHSAAIAVDFGLELILATRGRP